MKIYLVKIIVLFVGMAPATADPPLSVEDALSILEKSLDTEQRLTAIAALQHAEKEDVPALPYLKRQIFRNPVGVKADVAARTLGQIGKASINVVGELAPKGFDYSYLLGIHTVRSLSQDLEEELLLAAEPILSLNSADDRFNGILLLSWFPLAKDTANRVMKAQLADSSYSSKLGSALLLAKRANDPAIINTIESHPFKCMKFLAAKLRADWQRRDLKKIKTKIVPPRTEEELKRGKVVRDNLTKLASNAIPETLDHLKRAHGDHAKYLWMEVLRTLSSHSPLPRTKTLNTLDATRRKTGSKIDLLLSDFRRQIFAGDISTE